MSKRVNSFRLGLFVLVCGAMATASLIWLGAVEFYQPRKTYAAFFDESVEGLQPGADVSYRGLRVGSVSSLELAPDRRLIEVTIRLRSDFPVDSLAIALAQSGVTGPTYLALDRAPPNIAEQTPRISFPVKHPVIPSRPGQVARIEQALEHLVHKLDSLDVGGLIAEWTKSAQDVHSLLAEGDLRETLRNARVASADLRRVAGSLARSSTSRELGKGIQNAAAAAAAMRDSTEALAAQLRGIPPGTLPRLAGQLKQMVASSETIVGSWNRQADQTLALLRDSAFQLNQVLSETRGLARSLREEPGQILERSRNREPFRR